MKNILPDLAALFGVCMIGRGLYLWHEIAFYFGIGALLVLYGLVAMSRQPPAVPKRNKERSHAS